MRCCAETRPIHEDKNMRSKMKGSALHYHCHMVMNIESIYVLFAWTLTHEQIDERTEIATPNRTMLHVQNRVNERKTLKHFGTWKRDSVPKSSRDVSECNASAEIGLGARPCTCPQLTCSAETLLRSGVCLRNVNHRLKQTNLLTHPVYPIQGNRRFG